MVVRTMYIEGLMPTFTYDEFEDSVNYLVEGNTKLMNEIKQSDEKTREFILSCANYKIVEKNFELFIREPLQLFLDIADESVEFIKSDHFTYNLYIITAEEYFGKDKYHRNDKMLLYNMWFMRFNQIRHKSTVEAIKHLANSNCDTSTLKVGNTFDLRILPLDNNSKLVNLLKTFYKYL